MKRFISYLLLCCKGDTNKGTEVKFKKELEEIEVVYKRPRPKQKLLFKDTDKEHILESDITSIKKLPITKNLKRIHPSIILSMDGSDQQVVLFDSSVRNEMKKSEHKHKKRKKEKTQQNDKKCKLV